MAIRTWTAKEFAEAWGRHRDYVKGCCRGAVTPQGNGYKDSVKRLPDGFTAEKIDGEWVISGDEDNLPREKEGIVYFVQETRGTDYAIKIGFTGESDPEARGGRFAKFKNANWRSPQMVAAIKGTREIEREIHERFKHLRIAREWFKADWDLIHFLQDIRKGFPEIQPEIEPRLPQ